MSRQIGQSNSCNVSGYPTVGDPSIIDCSLHSELIVLHVVMPGCTSHFTILPLSLVLEITSASIFSALVVWSSHLTKF